MPHKLGLAPFMGACASIPWDAVALKGNLARLARKGFIMTYDKAKLNMVALMFLTECKHWDGSFEDLLIEYSNEYGLSVSSLANAVDALMQGGK